MLSESKSDLILFAEYKFVLVKSSGLHWIPNLGSLNIVLGCSGSVSSLYVCLMAKRRSLLALVAIKLTWHLLWVEMVLGLLSWVLLGLIGCLLLLGLKELVQLLAEPCTADCLAHVVHLLIWVNLLHILSGGERSCC